MCLLDRVGLVHNQHVENIHDAAEQSAMMVLVKLGKPFGTFEGFIAWRTRRRHQEVTSIGAGAQEEYAALIKDQVSPAMRSLGLQGSGGRYSIKSPTHWALVGFQKSAYSDRLEIRFTVNLLVVSRAGWANLRTEKPHVGNEPSATITYGAPVVTTRLGLVTAEHEDRWWQVGPGHDSQVAAQEVISDLQLFGVPWLRETMRQSDG